MVASSAWNLVRLYLIYLDGYFNLEFEFHPLHYINLGWGIMVCYKLGGGRCSMNVTWLFNFLYFLYLYLIVGYFRKDKVKGAPPHRYMDVYNVFE